VKEPIRPEGPVEIDEITTKDAAVETAAALIRESSAAARLVSESEVRLLLEEHLGLPETDSPCEDASDILTRAVHENEDLHSLTGAGSRWYYSSHSMTGSYATILLRAKEGPLRLIAETVRHNSREYQRPVPAEFFGKPPYNLAYQVVIDSLAAMAATEGYDDIATTTTSASGMYLYSTTYLETEHAEMLAEWFDVGQEENP
jgi:hypothetical protein